MVKAFCFHPYIHVHLSRFCALVGTFFLHVHVFSLLCIHAFSTPLVLKFDPVLKKNSEHAIIFFLKKKNLKCHIACSLLKCHIIFLPLKLSRCILTFKMLYGIFLWQLCQFTRESLLYFATLRQNLKILSPGILTL